VDVHKCRTANAAAVGGRPNPGPHRMKAGMADSSDPDVNELLKRSEKLQKRSDALAREFADISQKIAKLKKAANELLARGTRDREIEKRKRPR